jgi:hypothetical protein
VGRHRTTHLDRPQESIENTEQAGQETTGDFMKGERPISGILIFAVTAVCATSAGVCLDAFLSQQGLSESSILWASNALIGIAAGSLVLERNLRLKAKRQILEERIATLSEMHQHIKSVITSMAIYSTQIGGADSKVLSELLRRVEANLVDLFTRLLFDPAVPRNLLEAVRTSRIIRSVSNRSEKYASGASL